jgi:hypothetical protein
VRQILFSIAFIVFLTGFANPSVTRVNKEAINKITITRIFIPRFEGHPNFVEESTDLFIAELETRIQAVIVQGSALQAVISPPRNWPSRKRKKPMPKY